MYELAFNLLGKEIFCISLLATKKKKVYASIESKKLIIVENSYKGKENISYWE